MKDNFGFVHVGTAKKEALCEVDLKIARGNQVLETLSQGHACKKFMTLHLDLLLAQLLVPNMCGLPLVDVSTPSELLSERAEKTYTKSGGNNWPHVKVGGEECCVMQLLGLTQFKIVPRHPQSQKPRKYLNWGYGHNGICITIIHTGAATVRGVSASDPIVCE